MKLRSLLRLALIVSISSLLAVPTTADAARDPGGHTARGVKYTRKKQYDKAVEEFTKAIEAQPNDAKNYSNRALSYQLSGKLAEAKADYTKAIDLIPSSDDYTRRARIELRQKKIAAALQDLDKALKINSQNTNARRLRAYTHLQNKEWNKAIAGYDEIIKGSKKTDVEALERRGFAYRNLKKYDLALEDFSKVIKKTPKDVEALRRRVYIYRVMKQNDKAMADLHRILKMKKDDTDAKAQLAILEKPAAPSPAATGPVAKPQPKPKADKLRKATISPPVPAPN
jgi:tetratricopeptide (TPR) repeat protein